MHRSGEIVAGSLPLITRVCWASLMLLLAIVAQPSLSHAEADVSSEAKLRQARVLFYKSVTEEKHIKPAHKLFGEIVEADDAYKGRAMTYLGALTALRGKHASWPYTKLKLVKRGLALMDKGLKENPLDAEALFIHGSTCYYLPFLFGRRDEAIEDFRKLIRIFDAHMQDYDTELLRNVVDFLSDKPELAATASEQLQHLKQRLPVNVTQQ